MKRTQSEERLFGTPLRRQITGLTKVFFCVLLGCIATWAAINRGAIRGTVTDPQGAVVPGVAVTVTNSDTGVALTTRTDSAGFYYVPELIPGKYNLHFENTGFVAIDVSNVEVVANDVATADQQLKIGATSQHVEVTAATAAVDTAPANYSTTVEQRYMEELPLLGRDIQSMVQLIPGVTQTSGPPGTLVGFNGGKYGGFPDPTHIIGSMISVNGSQGGANLWYLDGNVNAAQDMDNTVVNPPPDAVSEFQAVTNGYAPEYGRTSGGVFNVVLKSGSNGLHGDLYEFNRNSFFSARNPFAGYDPFGHQRPPNPLNWNQFGGTVGGPVTIPHVYKGQDRTFFFVAWDISRLFAHAPSLFTVPTELERQGNFSEFPNIVQYGIYDPLSTKLPVGATVPTRQAFMNPNGTLATTLPAGRIDPVASWFMSQFPAPNFLDPRQQNATGGCLNTCNNFSGVYGSSDTSQSVVAKVDHTFSEKDKLFVEWLFNPTTYSMFQLPWTGATAQRSGFSGGVPWHVGNEIVALGNTSTFNPTLVNEFRLMYSRQADYPNPLPPTEINDQGVAQHLAGLNIPTFPPIQTQPAWGIGGLSSFGSPFNPQIQITQAYTALDNITKVISKHTIKAGFLYRNDITATTAPTQPYLSFGGSLTQNPSTGQGGSGIAQFLLGAVDQSSYVRFIGGTMGDTNQVGAYVQDDFRISPKFTLDIGLRWDMQGWYNDRHNNDSVFEWNVPNPVLPQYQGAIVYMGTTQHPSSRPWPAYHHDFSPRINFVYSPFADHKTVFRGGFDYIYTDGMTQVLGQGEGASESPGYNAYLRFPGDATGQGLFNTGVVPSFILSKGASTPPTFLNPRTFSATNDPTDWQWLGSAHGGFLSQMRNSHDPTVTIWSFEVQRELPWEMSIVAGYIGQKGTDLIAGNNTAFDYVSTANTLQYKSKLSEYVPMPAALVPYFGANYFQSELLRPMPQWPGFSNFLGLDAANIYHGFQLKLEKRFSHGLNFLLAYTAQKNIANASFGAYLSNTWTGGSGFAQGRGLPGNEWEQGIGYGGAGGEYQNLDDRRADRGLVPDDLPQIINFAWTYELPFGPGRAFAGSSHGIARYLIQGWKLTDNINIEPGIPQTISAPSNGLTSRPDLVGNPNAGRSGESRYQQEQQWWNPNAFTPPFGLSTDEINVATSGTPAQKDALPSWYVFGTEGIRNGSVRLPSFWNMDMSLGKDFRVGESKAVQFRADMYNALNHQNLGLPNENWCLPATSSSGTDAVHKFPCQFGLVNNIATDPRSVQFGLKFVW